MKKIVIDEEFQGWPSGDFKPILSASVTIDEIANLIGSKLVEGTDDLGEFLATFFSIEDIGPVVVVRHYNDPKKNAVINVDREVVTNLVVPEIINILRLDKSSVSWVQTRC